jgi:hypothetical protein
MFKRFLTGAVLALAAGLATSAAAEVGLHTVTFNKHTSFTCAPGTTSDSGLDFTGGWMSCFYTPGDPADFPFTLTSPVLGVGYADFTMSLTAGSVFDLLGLDLAAGRYTAPDDTTVVTGHFHDGTDITQTLTLTQPFTTYNLDWKDLDSVHFTQPQGPDSGYVTFDNIRVFGDLPNVGVPEPGEWVLLVGGLMACGYMLRRARQLAADA